MKSNSIYRVMMVIAFMLAVNIGAQAQLGNLGNRIKNNAKRKVENKIVNETDKATNKVVDKATDKATDKAKSATKKSTDKATEKATEKAADKAAEKVESTTGVSVQSESATSETQSSDDSKQASQPKLKKEPSAEAKAADPMANDNTVPPGFTKTNAQIRAAYESLDPNIFIFQPYYKFLNLDQKMDPENGLYALRAYVLDLNKDINEYAQVSYVRHLSEVFDQHWTLNASDRIKAFAIYYKMEDPKGNIGYVPYIDAASNALAVLVMADPDCDNALELAINSILLDRTDPRFDGDLVLEDIRTGTIDSKKDMYLLKNLGQYERSDAIKELFKANAERQARVVEYAKARKADVEKYTAAEDYAEASVSMRKLIMSVENFLNDKKEKERFWVYIRKTQTDVWRNAYKAASPAQPMPKTVASPGGSVEAKAIAAAKAEWGDKFVKLVFFENTWRAIKSQEYPYNVMGYYMTAGAVLKSGKDYMLQVFDLGKGAAGENIVIGPLGNITKVKYE